MRPVSAVVSVLVAMLALSATARAQNVPGEIGFAARVTDDGVPVEGTRDVTVRIFTEPTGGTAAWSEARTGVAIESGRLALLLGEVTALPEGLFDGGALYLELEVGGTVLVPRVDLVSVPYAVRAGVAASAETVGGIAPEDLITGVAAGSGLTGGGSTGDVSLAVDTATIQARIATACAAGTAMRAVAANGTPTCDPVGSTYTAGAGLNLAGGAFSVLFTTAGGDNGGATTVARGDHLHDGRYYTEAELNTAGTLNNGANPVDWTKLKNVPAGFADGTDNDTNTTYAAGTGISLTGTTFSANFTSSGGDNGAAVTVARGDHLHDGRYYTEAELNAAGTLNAGTNPVDWTKLKNVPAEIADGDENTTYSAGSGLSLGGTTFSVNFTAASTENGNAVTVARGDHRHDNRYYTEGELNTTGTINTPGNPVQWTKLAGVPAGFADGTDDDTNTTYAAGSGISLTGTTFSANFTASGGDNGSSVTVARGNHTHDALYYPRTVLNTAGTINTPGNPVQWSKLDGVPAGFSDGVDNNTTYTAGTGITINGTSVAVSFGTTSTTAARGDHTHNYAGQYRGRCPAYTADTLPFDNGDLLCYGPASADALTWPAAAALCRQGGGRICNLEDHAFACFIHGRNLTDVVGNQNTWFHRYGGSGLVANSCSLSFENVTISQGQFRAVCCYDSVLAQ